MHLRIRPALTLLYLISFLSLSNLAFAYSDEWRNEFKNGFMRGFANPESIETKIDLMGLRGEQRTVARNYLNELTTNEKFIDYMVDAYLTAPFMKEFTEGRLENEALYMQAIRFSYEVEADLSLRGLQRLSDENIKAFLAIMVNIFSKIEPEYCRSLAGFEASSQMQEISASLVMLQSLDTRNLRAYLRLNKLAINAELNDFPMVQNLNNYQIEQANLAFENALINAYQKYGSPGFLEALVDPDAASDEDICLSMMLTMQVAHDMEGITGKWMRAMFFR